MAGGPLGPVAGPLTLTDAVKKLEDRSFTTYKARLHASQRLQRRNSAWNACLIAFSTSTLIAAIGMLGKRDMYGEQGDTLMVALSLLSLVASLVVASMNYSGRSRSLEANYKRLQQISLRAESFKVDPSKATAENYYELLNEYSIALESSENHTSGDHALATKGSKGSRLLLAYLDMGVTIIPYAATLIPFAILVPFVAWLFNGS